MRHVMYFIWKSYLLYPPFKGSLCNSYNSNCFVSVTGNYNGPDQCAFLNMLKVMGSIYMLSASRVHHSGFTNIWVQLI